MSMGKLSIAVSERTVSRLLRRRRRPPSQTWRTFLTNHVASLVSMDFFTVPTLTGCVLFVLVLLTHHRRRIVHQAVTEHPTAAWTAQQIIIEAFPNDTAPRWLLRDRDAIYGDVFRRRVTVMAITEVITSPSSPWQNPYAERLIGSLRRERLDHVIVLGARHLRRLLTAYLTYYDGARTHLALGKDAPTTRRVQTPTKGPVVAFPEVGGLTSSLRTTCSLTGTVDRRLDLDVRLRVCAERPCVDGQRRSRKIVFATPSASEASAASRDGLAKDRFRSRAQPSGSRPDAHLAHHRSLAKLLNVPVSLESAAKGGAGNRRENCSEC